MKYTFALASKERQKGMESHWKEGLEKTFKKERLKLVIKKQSLTFATASQGKRLEMKRDAGMEEKKSLKKAWK